MTSLPHLLSLLLLTSTVLCSYNQDPTPIDESGYQFSLPDLGINYQEANCKNADALLAAANSDVARLTDFTNQDLAQSIQQAQQALSLTQQACQVQQKLKPATFLQAQKSSSSSKSRLALTSQLTVSLQDLSTRMSSQNNQQKSDLYHELIADKATHVSALLAQLASTQDSADSSSSSSAQDSNTVAEKSVTIDSACAGAQSSAKNLVDFLSYLSGQITNYFLGSDLPQRIADIQAVAANCAAPITQTGQVDKKYVSTSSPLATTGNKVRTDDITVTFSKPFASVPSVGIAIIGVDLEKAGPRMQLAVLSVNAASFVVRVTAVSGVPVYEVQFSYIATLSDKSGIYISTLTLEKSTDADLAKISSGSGQRTVTKALNPPANLQNVKSIAFLSTFDFGAGKYGRLSVSTSADSKSVTFTTWADTILLTAGATVVFWSGNDASVGTKLAGTAYAGVLQKGSGDRSQKVAVTTTSVYAGMPEVFFGIYYFDGANSANYRLRQTLSGTANSLAVTYTVWEDTQIYEVRTGFVMACQTVDKGRCLA